MGLGSGIRKKPVSDIENIDAFFLYGWTLLEKPEGQN
jgi:hypothetical protein